MINKTNTIAPIVKLGAWVLSFIAFLVGFWHTHLGLKEMRPFDSEYGSLLISAIILLLILISYNIAVNGRKLALLFYIIGGLFFFIFNLNFFYPSYLGRQLVKEESIELNDTLQSYSNKVSVIPASTFSVVSKANNLKDKIIDEIRGQDGFGERASDYLLQFNRLINGTQKPNRVVGKTQQERDTIAVRYERLLSNDIDNYIRDQWGQGNITNPNELLSGITDLKNIRDTTTIRLKMIIADDNRIPLEEVANHPQINTLQKLVTNLDNATIKINESSGTQTFLKLNEAKTRNLGRFAHTISSIRDRIKKIDTWGIILLCLFIDLLVPLFIYLMIRKKEGEEDIPWLPTLWGTKTGPETY